MVRYNEEIPSRKSFFNEIAGGPHASLPDCNLTGFRLTEPPDANANSRKACIRPKKAKKNGARRRRPDNIRWGTELFQRLNIKLA